LIHETVDVTVHSEEVEFNEENVPPSENLLSSLTNRVMKKGRITGFFPQLYRWFELTCANAASVAE
jgi:hypothetical protein